MGKTELEILYVCSSVSVTRVSVSVFYICVFVYIYVYVYIRLYTWYINSSAPVTICCKTLPCLEINLTELRLINT